MISTSTSPTLPPLHLFPFPHPFLPLPSLPTPGVSVRSERERERVREREGEESEESEKEWRRERGEVSAVFLSSFDCACPDVSMSVPVLEFPVTNSFRYGRIPAPLWLLLTFRFNLGRTGGPGLTEFSDSVKLQSVPRLCRLNFGSGKFCRSTGWAVHCAFG